MKPTELMKGFLIKSIMEILKRDFDIKSPTPTNLMVTYENGIWSVFYKSNLMMIDFSNYESIKNLIKEIENKPIYEKMWL
ncbi:MAG: hypothetical protein EBR27_11465 [Betaproteobacteria bacterium]|nr:hypothetical protein [Betaproteobacteria bacterium]